VDPIAWWWVLAAVPAVMWGALLVLPWQPWRNRERLEPVAADEQGQRASVTVLMPARDEAPVIARTMRALRAQGDGLRVMLVDDQSSDGTAELAREHGPEALRILPGTALPAGWSGKLWALEQGWRALEDDAADDGAWVLLLDADIELAPGTVDALLARAAVDDRHLVSVMATLATRGFWERLLLPAFVYYFRLLYPFALANSRSRSVAAAAGGCILLRRDALRAIGGFAAIREALIDDCTLARRVKDAGYRTWIGVSRGVRSLRSEAGLRPIWNMVARTAFTQLRYSWLLLALCLGLLAAAYLAPLAALAAPLPGPRFLAAGALAAMVLGYLPTLRFYRLSPLYALALPVVGCLYGLMTLSSALRHLRGERSRWKGRVYAAGGDGEPVP